MSSWGRDPKIHVRKVHSTPLFFSKNHKNVESKETAEVIQSNLPSSQESFATSLTSYFYSN